MNAAAERLEFAPPATPGLLRALLLAMIAHGLLVAALTWGVQWKQEARLTSAEAELWATVPEEAAPKLQDPPPEPEPVPAPQPEPIIKPVPEPKPVAEAPKVDIALEQEKRRIQKQQLELEKQQEKLKTEKLQQEKLLAEKLKQEKVLQDKLKADKLQADKQKQELADKAKQAEDRKLTEQQAKQLEAQRQKNLQRMAGLAGASGDTSAKGTAQTAAGPTAGYAGRIRARIKPNIVFTEDLAGNPSAEVEVRTSADGTIIARKLIKSSGDKAWDEAVLKAIDKTEMLPRDTDGRVPAELVISFRPKN
jgi:colicin import membrane protein